MFAASWFHWTRPLTFRVHQCTSRRHAAGSCVPSEHLKIRDKPYLYNFFFLFLSVYFFYTAMILLVITSVGVVAVCAVLIDSLWSPLEQITSYLTPYFLPAEVEPLTKKFGLWAAVTGSTDGIGKQYALELARRGCSVLLISRNQEKLSAVASQIEKEHNVKTKILVADFSKGAEVYAKIEEELHDVPIGILVNNVGINYDYPCAVCDLPPTKVWELINVNVGAVTMMTRAVLPGMVARGRGAVVNVSSGSELQPLPFMTVYAATKAYIRSFTLALREEYASKGIYIQHLSPMFVSTKINAFSQKLLEGNLFVPDAETYSRHAVETLGRIHNTTGFWLHGIQYFAIKVVPEWMRIKIGMMMNKNFQREYFQTQKIKVN